MTHNTPDQHDHNDPLDALLRQWHQDNASRARSQRDQLLASVSDTLAAKRASIGSAAPAPFDFAQFRRNLMTRYMPIAASLALVVTLIAFLVPMSAQPAYADGGMVMVPEGGKLEALDEHGNLIGPCALKHTDVHVNVSGFLARTTLTQEYHNPYDQKIEAVYTFPMSHQGAVDGFKMIVGDRIVEGEVKEREAARQIYEAARQQGYVASLLEQERPNIFTQSVANIEPEATVKIEISYIEFVEEKDGEYEFSFPMVVGPRYIPGAPTVSHSLIPAELTARRGVILLGPAQLTIGAAGDAAEHGTLQPGKLEALLTAAQAIEYPGDTWWGKGDDTGGAAQPALWHRFEAAYGDGSKEFGELFNDGTGWINGRWFYFDPKNIENMGTGFSQDTNQVPDASRITPMPVKPPTRAGHDISLTMTIDTGGLGIIELDSALHKIEGDDAIKIRDKAPRQITIALANQSEIPNRDFVVNWKQASDTITEATFTHTGDYGDFAGGFFTLILQPPDRVPDWPVRPRELIFVMDTSGSMNGNPIEKSKEVITRAIDSMRPDDTFNIITFAGDTSILWSQPRPATEQNRKEAQQFVTSRNGAGGTEMMTAIQTALVQEAPALRAENEKKPLTIEELANLPADGREVVVELNYAQWGIVAQHRGEGFADLSLRDDLTVRVQPEFKNVDGFIGCPVGESQLASGAWRTINGQRVFVMQSASWKNAQPLDPMRIVVFLTDGYVGNEAAIIQHVRDNADTTRVFSFGIGNSINRFLLDGMAEAGRGEVEYVLLASDSDEAVERFTRRIETPVLTDISLAFSDGLEVMDILPKGGRVPDLFDAKPLIIQGRYAPGKENKTGTLTITGQTGGGPYTRTLDVEFPAQQPDHRATATLWARKMVDEYTKQEDSEGIANIVKLGESFQIMTKHTSFVAVEKSRVTIEGEPVLVAIPVEMPDGTRWEGFFGSEVAEDRRDDLVMLGAQMRFKSADEDSIDALAAGYAFEPGIAGKQITSLGVETLTANNKNVGVYYMRPAKESEDAAGLDLFFDKSQNGRTGMADRLIYDGTAGENLFANSPNLNLNEALRKGGLPGRERAESETRLGRIQTSTSTLEVQRAASGAGPALAGQAAPPPPASRPAAPPTAESASKGDARDFGVANGAPSGGARRELDRSGALHDNAARGQGGGGGFGGGGGGGGSGGGGTIFDDPSDEPMRVGDELAEITEEEKQVMAENVITEFVYAESWDINGGNQLRLDWANSKPVVTPLQSSKDALAQAIIAQAFVDHYLPVLLPDVTDETLELMNHTDFVDTPANIALLKKLGEKRISVSIKGGTFEAALQAIAEQGEIPIIVEWNAINDVMDVAPETTASLDVADMPIGEAIESLLISVAPDELDRPVASVVGGTVLISTHDRLASHTTLQVYDISDLTTITVDTKTGVSYGLVSEIVDSITNLIEPDGWDLYGGSWYSVRELDGMLVVRGSLDVHRRIVSLLAALREGVQPRTDVTAWRMPGTLGRSFTNRTMQVFDVRSLTPADFDSSDEYADKLIADWKRDLEDLDAYPIAREDVSTSQLANLVSIQVEPDLWECNGGDGGSLHSFRGMLIVSAPQSMQERIEALLRVKMVHEINMPTLVEGKTSPGSANWAEQAVHRMDRLAKVLDPALLPMAIAPSDENIPAGINTSDAGLRLTVLTTSIDDKMISSLKAVGVTVEATSPAGPFVVAHVPSDALWKLAMMDGVRRIEPARLKAASR